MTRNEIYVAFAYIRAEEPSKALAKFMALIDLADRDGYQQGFKDCQKARAQVDGLTDMIMKGIK